MFPVELRPLDMFLQLVEKGHFLAAQDLVPMVRATIDDLIESQLEDDVDTALSTVFGMVAKDPGEEKAPEELATDPQ